MLKFALYSVLFLSAIGGVFFAGDKYGSERIKQQYAKEHIRQTDDNIKTKHEIDNIGSARGVYDLSNRLQSGIF